MKDFNLAEAFPLEVQPPSLVVTRLGDFLWISNGLRHLIAPARRKGRG